MDVKMNLRIIMKNHAADSKIRSPLKIDFKADLTHESKPSAWESIFTDFLLTKQFLKIGHLLEARTSLLEKVLRNKLIET